MAKYKKVFRGKVSNFTAVVTKKGNGVFMVSLNIPYPICCYTGTVSYFRKEWIAINHAKRMLENAESIEKHKLYI